MKVEIIPENDFEANLLREVEEAHRMKKKTVLINSKDLKKVTNLGALPYVVQTFTQRLGDRTNIVLCIA